MAIYVDPIYNWGAKGEWCHMATDGDLDDLHTLAQRIGLRRSWFQDHPLHPHYDLRPSKRLLAVRHGAIEVTRVELAQKCSKFLNASPSRPTDKED
jgi:hypothetical protein